jgi:hypothetical protein
MMRLDEDEPVTGKSRGRNKSLNLKGQAFIGGWSLAQSFLSLPGVLLMSSGSGVTLKTLCLMSQGHYQPSSFSTIS